MSQGYRLVQEACNAKTQVSYEELVRQICSLKIKGVGSGSGENMEVFAVVGEVVTGDLLV